MSKRTANLIVISSHAVASPIVHCAPQLGLRQSENRGEGDELLKCPRVFDLRRGSVSGGESHRGSNGAATNARHVCGGLC